MEPPSRRRISVINTSGRKLSVSPIKRAAELALATSAPPALGALCVLLADEAEVQALNLQYRGVDEPTDVLTFPAAEMPGAPLGDIAIAVPYAERQAEKRGIALQEELQYLAIHGVLHLLGYDDETDHDRKEMFAKMEEVGRQAGLPPEPEWSSLLHGEGA